MKRLVLILILVLMQHTAHAQYDSLYVHGGWRTFLTHLPPQYQTEQNIYYPLILALHGGLGSAANLENQSLLSHKADTAAIPFIVVYPEGVPGPVGFGVRSWNAGICCGYAGDVQVDDVGFIATLIDTLVARYSVNPQQIFITGMSNGGMMTYRLAAELPHPIAAIAPVSSTMMLPGPWLPSQAIPIMHFHSYQDESIPFYGGYGDGFTSEIYKFPVDSVLTVWADLYGCDARSDTLYHQAGEYLHKTWSHCNNNADVQLYVTYDGGHSWPGGNKGSAISDPVSNKISATNLIWEFFSQFVGTDPTSIREVNTKPKQFVLHQNFPNPFNQNTMIRYQLSVNTNINVSIFNAFEQLVRSFAIGNQNPGVYSIPWDGYDDAGNLAGSGVYLYRLECGTFFQTEKMLLLK
ncbi:T9SS type A sorting domain-containing protein [candidate division KSB1 bacterium]|nr:T9SS type A sorting domain-containing protein [candidate division KSB1 bacterium]